MSTPKERHYWSQLRISLTAGQWRASAPAKTPNGTPISWSELFRKFNKHCRGYQDVSEVAVQTHGLGLLISSKYVDEDEDRELDSMGTSKAATNGLDLGQESVLAPERVEEATATYEALKALEASNFDTINFILAYYAYALGNPAECIQHLDKIPHLLLFQNHVPTLGSTRSTTTTVGSSGGNSGALLAPSSYAPSTNSFTGSFASVVDNSVPEVRDGRAWALAETLRSVCLKGMSYEKLYPGNSSKALDAYTQSIPLLHALEREFSYSLRSYSSTGYPPTHVSTGGKMDVTIFNQMRELWRWTERLLWRAIVLSSRTTNLYEPYESPDTDENPSSSTKARATLWHWLAHYSQLSTFWPPTFRSEHRITVASIHLHALIQRFGVPHDAPLTMYFQRATARRPQDASLPASSSASARASTAHLVSPSTVNSRFSSYVDGSSASQPTGSSKLLPNEYTWLSTARSVVNDYRAVLTHCTKFPKAGERNTKVEEFVELCVAVWEAAGAAGASGGVGNTAGASWVIDILWWATRLTFNSSHVLRHLTKLLYLSGDYNLAQRTLKLYTQVVGKAYEASKEGVGEDKDNDDAWVDTCVFGARMLCREACEATGVWASGGWRGSNSKGTSLTTVNDNGLTTMKDIKEAGRMIELAKTRLDKDNAVLVGLVEHAEGVYYNVLGTLGNEPLKRTEYLKKGHAHLLASLAAFQSASNSSDSSDDSQDGETSSSSSSTFETPAPSPNPLASPLSANLTPILSSTPDGVKSAGASISSRGDAMPVTTPPVQAPTFYHLALSFARRSGPSYDLDKAITCAGNAVEGQPGDVRYWHLLGLLLAAKERWSEAREILQRGEACPGGECGDEDDIDTETEEGETNGSAQRNADLPSLSVNGEEVKATDFAAKGGEGKVNGFDRTPSSAGTSTTALPSYLGPAVSKAPRKKASSLPGPVQPSAHVVEQAEQTLLSTTDTSLPRASTLLRKPFPFDSYPPTSQDLLEWHLQLRMSEVALEEVTEGPEGAEQGWVDVFAWFAKIRGANAGSATPSGGASNLGHRHSFEIVRLSMDANGNPVSALPPGQPVDGNRPSSDIPQNASTTLGPNLPPNEHVPLAGPIPIPITISPATPEVEKKMEASIDSVLSGEGIKERSSREKEREKEKKGSNGLLKPKRSSSSLRGENTGTQKDKGTKKVQQMQQALKNRVHKGRAGLTAVSRRIGHGVSRNGAGLRQSTSTPDFHLVLQQTSYQASSIHSRRRLSSVIHSRDRTPTDSPPPPPPPPLPAGSEPSATQQDFKSQSERITKENKMLSDLWLMSAATFRRLGKDDQAKGAIQEAEVRNENNAAVWVQLGLYHTALKQYQHAIDTFQKALFISQDDVSATVHLARLWLNPDVFDKLHPPSSASPPSPATAQKQHTAGPNAHPTPFMQPPDSDTSLSTLMQSQVDLAVCMLEQSVQGRGWDVPEVWYYLARAYGVQGRKEKERETLKLALKLSDGRSVRDITLALGVGW
ncbi:hypothetical protein CVT24_004415 [Panaeolus cyanescens]|uniref:TPR-like protein n=1 Tax=Panaeolus cyanescens TaxID=181874 RepID=A0A409VA11_9AGAR|nr:hypothetical protein CVT24_004415 [Panaeolus cyanescens]